MKKLVCPGSVHAGYIITVFNELIPARYDLPYPYMRVRIRVIIDSYLKIRGFKLIDI